jgi:hypothetical protein
MSGIFNGFRRKQPNPTGEDLFNPVRFLRKQLVHRGFLATTATNVDNPLLVLTAYLLSSTPSMHPQHQNRTTSLNQPSFFPAPFTAVLKDTKAKANGAEAKEDCFENTEFEGWWSQQQEDEKEVASDAHQLETESDDDNDSDCSDESTNINPCTIGLG